MNTLQPCWQQTTEAMAVIPMPTVAGNEAGAGGTCKYSKYPRYQSSMVHWSADANRSTNSVSDFEGVVSNHCNSEERSVNDMKKAPQAPQVSRSSTSRRKERGTTIILNRFSPVSTRVTLIKRSRAGKMMAWSLISDMLLRTLIQDAKPMRFNVMPPTEEGTRFAYTCACWKHVSGCCCSSSVVVCCWDRWWKSCCCSLLLCSFDWCWFFCSMNFSKEMERRVSLASERLRYLNCCGWKRWVVVVVITLMEAAFAAIFFELLIVYS